ncbi:SMI1/KNR4 family protein [Rhodococcus sp. NPDC057014]|uniref:SMI1/KNR4 family protein n=1 Tax=Rhodococcus sp. NPDC057014 TaxID=3346000 RepID=UPI0036340F31
MTDGTVRGDAPDEIAAIKAILHTSTEEQVLELLRSTPASSVLEQWTRIASWLRTNLSHPALVGATDEQIADAEQATAVWTSELREFYRLINGFPRENWISLFPRHELLSLDRVVADHHRRVEGATIAYYGPPVSPDKFAKEPAGSPSEVFLSAFIPIGNADSDHLFVDTRPGPLHGCVNEWPREDWAWEPPLWLSLSSMLADLATSLERTSALKVRRTQWVPSIVDERLAWNPAV